jgi:hypothetical protein
MAGSKQRISVILDASAYRRFEAYCELNGFKKSTLIARLVREHLDAVHFTGVQADFPFAEAKRWRER